MLKTTITLFMSTSFSLMIIGCGEPASLDFDDIHTELHQQEASGARAHFPTLGVSTPHGVRLEMSDLLTLYRGNDIVFSDVIGGITRKFEIKRIRNLPSGGHSWFGQIDDDPSSYFSVTYSNGHAVGSAVIANQLYRLNTTSEGELIMSRAQPDTVQCANQKHEHSRFGGQTP